MCALRTPDIEAVRGVRFFRGNIINNFERIKAYYNENGIRYTDLLNSERNVLGLSYKAQNMSSVEAYVIFDENLLSAHTICNSIANFKGKESVAMRVCNDVHKRFRWVCFAVDSDGDIRAEMDIMLAPATAAMFAAAPWRSFAALLTTPTPNS